MTDSSDPSQKHDASSPEDDDALVALLQRSLAEPPAPRKSILPAVQKKIRRQSHGRFYRDRWSQGRRPIPLLLMVALLIFMLITAVFMVWHPLVSDSEPKKLAPPPQDPFFAPESSTSP